LKFSFSWFLLRQLHHGKKASTQKAYRRLKTELPGFGYCWFGRWGVEEIASSSGALGRWGEIMTYFSMQHMPLSQAYLCQDCNCVGNCPAQCPACASAALIGLDGVLNRKAEETAQMSYSRVSALAA